jgi:DNA-binding XRE family transcriptional regulator
MRTYPAGGRMAPTVLILDQSGIGPRIAEARKLRGLTQDGLAMRIPCSKSLISQVERGVSPRHRGLLRQWRVR